MVLSVNTAFDAIDWADSEHRYLITIHMDTSTSYKALNGTSSQIDEPIAVTDVSALASSHDVFSRTTQTGEVTVTVQDAWFRDIMVANRIKGRKITIQVGTADLAEANFENAFVGAIEEVLPIDGTSVELTCLDAISLLDSREIQVSYRNLHPVTILDDILDRAEIPAELRDSSAFDPSTYSDSISHWVLSRTGRQAISEPTASSQIFNEILELINGTLTVNESGQMSLALFNSAAAADDTWTADDYGDFKQESVSENILNRVTVVFMLEGYKAHTQEVREDDTDSQAAYAYPGEAKRILSRKIETPWVHCSMGLNGGITDTATSITLGIGDMHALTGSVVPSNWLPSGTQDSSVTVTASRPAYLRIDAEIVKATNMVLDKNNVSWTHYTDPRTGAITRSTPFSNSVVATIVRGQLGTTPAAHSTGVLADPWSVDDRTRKVTDITIPHSMASERIKRFSDGYDIISCHTSWAKFKYQRGDLIKLPNSDYISFGRDGLTTETFEIISKEMDDAGIQWRLASAAEASPTFGYSVQTLAQGAEASYELALSGYHGATGENHVEIGFTVSDQGNLDVAIATGSSAHINVRGGIEAASEIAVPASKDTYIRWDQSNRSTMAVSTAIGAGEPDLPTGVLRLAKVVSGAATITSITDQRELKALSGQRIVAASISSAEIAAGAVNWGHITGMTFNAYLNDTASGGATKETATQIFYDAEDHDVGGNFDADGSDSDFTAPETGVYTFAAKAQLLAMANGTYGALQLRLNGALERGNSRVYNHTGGSATIYLQEAFGSISLSAGTSVECWIYNSDTTNRTIQPGAGVTYFSGQRVD